jgi:2-isopropylmalate synthase
MKVEIYDTTLRDGCQGEGISFSIERKLDITRELDALGVHFIEGGWPGSNPRDTEYFQRVRHLKLKNSVIAAFSFVGRVGVPAAEDQSLIALLEAGTAVTTVVGKSWDLHVEAVLRTTLDVNRRLIRDAVRHLVSHGRRVFYDAEQFFDGYKANPEYAVETLEAAAEGGAEVLVLCDTNGGTMPWEVEEIVLQVRKQIGLPIGIHSHNDCEMGVANALAAVRCGAVQVQGTIDGYGERVGNANLSSIIPNLKLKMGIHCVTDEQLARLTSVSNLVSEATGLMPNSRAPFVGRSAFAHKAGLHADATMKLRRSYQHIAPEAVGNETRILISELAGKGNILLKAAEFGVGNLGPEEARIVAQRVKDRESEGYAYERAEASFEMLMRRTVRHHVAGFEAVEYSVATLQTAWGEQSAATVKVRVGAQHHEMTCQRENPADALWAALVAALGAPYPAAHTLSLVSCDVESGEHAGRPHGVTRVFLTARSESGRQWRTVGCGAGVLDATWQALTDSLEYGLLNRAVTRV